MANDIAPKKYCQLWAISMSVILPVPISFLKRDLYLL